MALVHDEPIMDLIRSRLANSERALSRVLRSFYRLSTYSPEDHQHLDQASQAPDSPESYNERLYMQHATFLIELNTLTRSLSDSKGHRIMQMTARELDGLEKEKVRLLNESLGETGRISELELELEEARRERKNKIMYEEIGKEVRRFGDRFQSAVRINGLAKEIEILLEEQRLYAERWKSRRDQFDTVVSNLEVLQESIKEEKADADRKKALNDDDADDEEARVGEEEEAEQEGPSEPPKLAIDADNNTLDTSSTVPSALGHVDSGSRSTTLNPCASTFFPDVTSHISGVSTPENPSGSRTLGTPQVPIERPSSRSEYNGMEIDLSDEHENEDIFVNGHDVDDDATMEDGEEREEAEEGQEMERD